MDEAMARDLARQLREHIAYNSNQGDIEQFDQEVIALIKVVENQCAMVVEETPVQLFIVAANPRSILALIAAAIRGAI